MKICLLNKIRAKRSIKTKLAEEIRAIDEYLFKVNEELATIKAIVRLNKKWERQLKKKTPSDNIQSRHTKVTLSQKDLDLHTSIMKVILEEHFEYNKWITQSVEKANKLKQAFWDKRNAGIARAVEILAASKPLTHNLQDNFSFKKMKTNKTLSLIDIKYKRYAMNFMILLYYEKEPIYNRC